MFLAAGCGMVTAVFSYLPICWFLIEKDVMLQRLYTGGI